MNSEGLRPIPRFENEAQEREFWETHDSTDYVDWSKAERVRFPNLKPSSKASDPDSAGAHGGGQSDRLTAE